MFASKTPRDLNRDPRPYLVQHNEVNPILVAFRRDGGTATNWLANLDGRTMTAMDEEFYHARRVLSRLAALESNE